MKGKDNMGLNESIDKMMGLATGSRDPQALNAVMEVQRQLIQIQSENKTLRERIEELENEKILSNELEYKNNVYYRKGEENKPYCKRCYDVDKKLVTLDWTIDLYSSTYTFRCPECENTYGSGIEHHQDTHIEF